MKKQKPEQQEERKNAADIDQNTELPEPVETGTNEEKAETESAGQAKTDTSVEDLADKVKDDIRALEEKLAETQDKYIRLSAEFDNYRKRTLREKMELSKYAEENILASLIPIMDDFDRALLHINTSDSEAVKNGISLIYTKFSDFLKQNGLKEIEALNSDFTVDLHEAVAKVPVDDPGMKGKVVDVALKGYYLRDKVLRHAKVVVGE